MIQQSSFVKKKKKKKAYKVANKGKVNALLMEHNSSKVLCASDFFFWSVDYIPNNLCPFMEIKAMSELMFATEACQHCS